MAPGLIILLYRFCANLFPMQYVVPHRSPSEIDVEVCITTCHAHQAVSESNITFQGHWKTVFQEICITKSFQSNRSKHFLSFFNEKNLYRESLQDFGNNK